MPTHLSVKSLASRWEVGISTIWAWAKQNKIPQPHKLSTNITRWKLSEIEEWEAKQGGGK